MLYYGSTEDVLQASVSYKEWRWPSCAVLTKQLSQVMLVSALSCRSVLRQQDLIIIITDCRCQPETVTKYRHVCIMLSLYTVVAVRKGNVTARIIHLFFGQDLVKYSRWPRNCQLTAAISIHQPQPYVWIGKKLSSKPEGAKLFCSNEP